MSCKLKEIGYMNVFLIIYFFKRKEIGQEPQRGYTFLIRYSLKLEEVDLKLQSAYMSMFLITYIFKAARITLDQDLQRGYVIMFLIRYASKARGSRPGPPKRIFECSP